jgi:hypothetical protein
MCPRKDDKDTAVCLFCSAVGCPGPVHPCGVHKYVLYVVLRQNVAYHNVYVT